MASALAFILLLSACGGQPPKPTVERAEVSTPSQAAPAKTARKPTFKKGGGYYLDDGPGDDGPEDLDAIPDAVPRIEPLHRFANNPYSALGRDYVPMRELKPYRAQGIASWYGRRYHGQRTSSGEPYNMYGMTAAHPTLPIPSYVRVTNPANGKSVVVRVNDRGPFHAGRLIDLSFTAAWKLGYVENGSTLVEVESIIPGREAPVAQAKPTADPIAQFAAEPEPAAKPLPEVADARGHYLQLGAFGNRDNAEALRARLARELGALGDKLVVQAAGNLYRVQLGPWAQAQEAQRIADRVRETLDFKPVVIQR